MKNDLFDLDIKVEHINVGASVKPDSFWTYDYGCVTWTCNCPPTVTTA